VQPAGRWGAALYGGSLDDILAGAIQGGVIGGFTAGAFYGVGSAFSGTEGALGSSNSIGAVASHGVVGGASESAQGGDFWKGFVAAAATKAMNAYGPRLQSIAAKIARAATIGGTVAAISGGKFGHYHLDLAEYFCIIAVIGANRHDMRSRQPDFHRRSQGHGPYGSRPLA